MFNREEKKLANLIFYGSRACAIESYIPFLEKFPALEKLDNKREGLENDFAEFSFGEFLAIKNAAKPPPRHSRF